MKKRIAAILTVLMAAGLVIAMIPSVLAASVSCDFTSVNKGGKGGFVDNLEQGALETVEEDGRSALKFTPNPECAGKDKLLALEGNGFSRSVKADYKTFRYMSVEYKYISENPIDAKMSVNLCNSNKVFEQGGGVAEGSKLVAGEWTTAYFDLTKVVDGRLKTSIDTHTVNHLHIRPYGSGMKAGNVPAGDVFYIGKITFSEENLDPNGTTTKAPEITETTTDEGKDTTASPAKTETPATLGNGGVSPKVVGEDDVLVEFSSLSGSIVDGKDVGTVEKVTVDGRTLFKYSANPTAADAGNIVAFECSGLSGKLPKRITYEEYKYITVEYYYDTDNPSITGRGGMYLANSNKIFNGGGGVVNSDEPLVTKQWAIATFKIDQFNSKLVDTMDEHTLNHVHLRMFNTKASSLRTTDVIYIGKMGFHKENPSPKEEYTLTFRAGITGASGSVEDVVVKANSTYKLPENPYTIDGFTFAGWSNGIDTYNPGDEITVDGNASYSFSGVWVENATEEPIKGFEYINLFSEVCDKATNVTAEKVEVGGVSAIKATPAPADGKVAKMILDAYGLRNKIKVDLHKYKYVTVVYKYEGAALPEGVVRPHVQFTRNSGMFLKGGPALVHVSDGRSVGGWTSATYEVPDQTGNWTDPNGTHTLTQFHIYPFGNKLDNTAFSAESVCYIQGVAFSEEIPEYVDFAPAYITGFEDGSFGIANPMTRAQACTIVARLLAGSDEAVPAGASAFADVAADAWYTKYIAYCEAKGLLASYSGTFAPDKNITRAEFAELVYNMGIVKATDTVKTFADVSASHPKYTVISAAASAGLINGYPEADGTYTFKPDNEINRAEVVTVINNAYGRKLAKADVENQIGLFTDVTPDHWAFAAIVDAAVSHVNARVPGSDSSIYLYGYTKEVQIGEEQFALGAAKLSEVDALTEKRIAEIRNTTTNVTVTGTKYYFAADGDDSNDGLSPEKPKKTITAVNKLGLKSGDGVFFKRGDTFRGSVQTRSGVTYSAYGEGAKPIITRSPADFAGADNWEQTEVANVWKLKTPIKHDVGLIVFDEGKETESWSQKRIKGRSDFKEGGIQNLDVDLAMWHDVSAPTNVEGYVYVRSDSGNPGTRFGSIEIGPRDAIFKGTSNVTIDNLCLKFTGAHAIGCGTVNNFIVTNCEFGWIGGSWFRTDTLSRYGNAVEVYGGCDNYVVDNCYIYQVYDAGVTHQYTEGATTNILMKDIKYTNNVITDTSYPVEYFTHKPAAGYYHLMQNFEITGNIIRNTGYGFGDQRPDKTAAAAIKGWSSHHNEAENYTITNNIFDRSKYMLLHIGAGSAAWNPKMTGNTYIQHFGMDFGTYGSFDVAYNGAIEAIVKTGIKDETAQIYFLAPIEK